MVKRRDYFHTASEDQTSSSLDIKLEPLKSGGCPHKYLAKNNGSCVLPQRIDMFEHYAKTGGMYGAKEPFDKLVNNAQSFQRFI